MWVPADAVRLVGLLGLATAALWFDGVAVALMLLVLGGLMVPRALRTPRPLDVAYGVGLVVAAWSGVLDVYERVAWWDVAVHFTVTGLVAAVAYVGTVRLGVTRDPGDVRSRAHRVGVPLVVASLGLGLSVLWEVGEWLGHTYVDASIHVSEVDTLGDLVAGGAGSLVAGALLVAWGGSVRGEDGGGGLASRRRALPPVAASRARHMTKESTMSTSASPGPDPLRTDREGVDDLDAGRGGPTSPGPDSTAAGAATSGSGLDVNAPDTGPGPAAADVDGPGVDRRDDRRGDLDDDPANRI